MPVLDVHTARWFRLEFQQARENALKDAEAFADIIYVIERLGSFRLGEVKGLSDYEEVLTEDAKCSALAFEVPGRWRTDHIPFDVLYAVVKNARNDAMHVGAYARHLTTHAIELCLILEDALRVIESPPNNQDTMEAKVSDFMIRTPICAQTWQPMSLTRQVMLTNSFSGSSGKKLGMERWERRVKKRG